MSHEKAIASGKEHRKPYRRSARFDTSCRHGGSCSWCEGNRTYVNKKQKQEAKDRLKEG